MRSSPVETTQLVEAVRALAEEYGQIHGIRVEIWTSGSQEQLTSAQREVTYHVIREALTNIRRHSGARVCRVRLAFDGMPFLIEISDEGRGFLGGLTSGYGLIGMRERAVGIGCRLEIVTTVERGTRVFLFGPTPFG